MKLLIRTGILVVFAAALPLQSKADFSINTTDTNAVATFSAGATVEHFDDLSALTITDYSSQTVPSGNQFSSRNLVTFTSPFYNSGGASFNDPVNNPGTPIGIYAPGGAIASDVQSGSNVAGPLATGTDQSFGFGFMEVIFPTDMSVVGFWITHASGPITLFLKDSNNTNLTTGTFQVTGTEGFFIGISRDLPDIRGVTIGFTESFTIDDFTFSASPAIPEPSTIGLVAFGLVGVIGATSRERRAAR